MMYPVLKEVVLYFITNGEKIHKEVELLEKFNRSS